MGAEMSQSARNRDSMGATVGGARVVPCGSGRQPWRSHPAPEPGAGGGGGGGARGGAPGPPPGGFAQPRQSLPDPQDEAGSSTGGPRWPASTAPPSVVTRTPRAGSARSTASSQAGPSYHQCPNSS